MALTRTKLITCWKFVEMFRKISWLTLTKNWVEKIVFCASCCFERGNSQPLGCGGHLTTTQGIPPANQNVQSNQRHCSQRATRPLSVGLLRHISSSHPNHSWQLMGVLSTKKYPERGNQEFLYISSDFL